MANREFSPYLSKLPKRDKSTKGSRSYDPRQVYQYIFDNSDRYGIIVYTQFELADAIKIQRETMNYFFLDFMTLGFIEKINKKTFKVLRDPKTIEWTDELMDELERLRKTHQTYYRRKNKQGEE
jgi:hypothetical protein